MREPGRRRQSTSTYRLHSFRRRGRRLLYDPASGGSVELDEIGELAARLLEGRLSRARLSRIARARREEVEAALGDFADLRAQGHFHPVSTPVQGLHPRRAYDCSVTLSQECNLACRYCFRHRVGPHQAPASMSREVLAATASFVAGVNSEALSFCAPAVCMASEATLALPLYDEFRALLTEEASARQMMAVVRVNSSNLAALSTPAIMDRMRDVRIRGVSIDGPPEAHDAVRRRPDGSGTYAEVVSNLGAIRALGHEPYAAAVVTALYPDVSEVYFHLFGLGFPYVYVKPVRAAPDQPFALKHGWRAISKGYERYVDRLLNLAEAELLSCLLRSYPDAIDYFMRFFSRVVERAPVPGRCPAGTHMVSIDTDGKLYACDSLLGLPAACVGSVWEGIDERRVHALRDSLHPARRAPCQDCWAALICGGGCMHQSYLTYGDLTTVDPSECALNRHLIELAIWLQAELAATRPKVLAALPVIERRPWRGMPTPVPCLSTAGMRRSAGRPDGLWQAAPSGRADPATDLKLRLRDDVDDQPCELRLGWDEERLYVLLTSVQQPQRRGWTRVTDIAVYTAASARVVRSDRIEVPPLMVDTERWIAASIAGHGMRYEDIAGFALGGREVPEAGVWMDERGCWVSLPWAALAVPRAEAGVEFGLKVVVRDQAGGELEWEPRYSACRVRLEEGCAVGAG
jgi:uncharacterized protein